MYIDENALSTNVFEYSLIFEKINTEED